MSTTRRQIFGAGIAISTTSLINASMASILTPKTTAGPFYPNMEIPEIDADLTRIAGRAGTALGDIVDLSGRLLNQNGVPVKNGRIEIWQCDVNGCYRHTSERSNETIDRNFQGFGFTNTSSLGEYYFRTIKPIAYPGRAPHIHFKVLLPDRGKLVTQLYIENDKRNKSDSLYNRLTEEQIARSVTRFEPSTDGLFKAKYDLVIQQ